MPYQPKAERNNEPGSRISRLQQRQAVYKSQGKDHLAGIVSESLKQEKQSRDAEIVEELLNSDTIKGV